ncbi:glycosyltransferase family 2 protein [Methylocapsa acidiphila]|uniref:glycosyltransferase family 2 protein n=1 Tax=Methylocapsa acidiphila TaxID=133552 RepID=UPI00040DB41D|nr:glycosyltransferase family 2 protein [Methylocapsa acidiphila]
MEASRAATSLSASGPDEDKSRLRLPLVSVIVINFNYGRFVAAAAESILAQTYPNVECIIVDNASTDESGEVLRQIEQTRPNVRIIRRATNDGQTPAALDGLAASEGHYVIFVDADDLLLPHCVETHVFVHLSLRVHVGFTSGDMLQTVDDQVVLGTEHAFNRTILERRFVKRDTARPYRHVLGAPWPEASFDCTVLDTIRFVPMAANQWVWAPTSANCFRRDALALFADHPSLRNLRTGTDIYFCLGINAVSGSVLIDRPVAVYRLHGGNIYSRRPQLNHVLCYEPGGAGDSNALAKAFLIDHLIERAERFVGLGWTKFDYAKLLLRLDCENPDADAPPWARRSRLAAALVAYFKIFARVMGPLHAKALMLLARVPLAEFRRPR